MEEDYDSDGEEAPSQPSFSLALPGSNSLSFPSSNQLALPGTNLNQFNSNAQPTATSSITTNGGSEPLGLTLPSASSSAAVWNPMLQIQPIIIKQPDPEDVQQSENLNNRESDYDSDDSVPFLKDPAKIKFSDLFAPKLRIVKPVVNKKLFKKPPQRNQIYQLSRNDVEVFLGRIPQQSKSESWGIYRGRRWKENIEERELFSGKPLPPSLDPVVLDDWENKIIWDDDGENDRSRQIGEKDPREDQARLLIRNTALDREDWTDAILWDDEDNFVLPPIIFNDPTIVNDLKDWGYGKDVSKPVAALPSKLPFQTDRYNLSNDQYYVKSRNEEVRSSAGGAILKHARAAIEMMWPHYKTQLNTQELRNFHRPPIKFVAGEEIKFSRVKGVKKKKEVEAIQDFVNLTVKDASNFVLLEYTEEYPPILNNFGMGTLLQNFYRKRNEKDLTTPKADIGQHTPLEKIDASPFCNFGDVLPGDMVQGITNNLVRAPVFRHEIPSTDFLLIRYTYNNKTKYYLRDCPFVFVVGQTYPQQEVPRPQSRKVLNLNKFRLHSIAFRLMMNNPNQRLWYPKLQKYYVGQSDTKVKQILREVAQNWKKGENTGWYKVKQSKTLPTEEELQKIITPEWCCLLETAYAGEQRLKDIGYTNLKLGEAPGGDDAYELEENSADLEIQMAPWILTKNFCMTMTGKGMVQLYGGGDPTGCGEGFSFIRQSMKEMFYREGEAPPPSALKTPKNLVRFSYSEQQVVYREEIQRIWNAQFKSLSSKKLVELPAEEELGAEDDDDDEKVNKADVEEKQGVKKDDDAASVASSSAKSNRRLVIKRLMRLSDGSHEWKSEILKDQRVINAYLFHQAKLHEQALAASAPPPPEEGPKKRRKKLPDQVIVDSSAPLPQAKSDIQPSLKFKLSLSSMSNKASTSQATSSQLSVSAQPPVKSPNEMELDEAELESQLTEWLG